MVLERPLGMSFSLECMPWLIPPAVMAGKDGDAVPELDNFPLIGLRARSLGDRGAGDCGGLVVTFSIGSFKFNDEDDKVWVIGAIIAVEAIVSVEELVASDLAEKASSAECCLRGTTLADDSGPADSGSDADG